MDRPRLLAAGLALAALVPPASALQVRSAGTAPDGQPGLAREGSQSDLLRTFRSQRDEDRELLAGLRDVSSEVRLLLAGALEAYRGAGYLDLLELGAQRDLAGLHAAWWVALEDPHGLLKEGGQRARAFARMVSDPRFVVRADLAAGFELEAREVRAGLAVLEAAATSFVQLRDDEAFAIAVRVDFAGSRLRALRSDLLALRTRADRPSDGGRAARDEPRVEALLAAARGQDAAAARAALDERLDQAWRRADQMRSALFSTRLEARVLQALDARARAFEEARGLRDEAERVLPGGALEADAPEEVLAMRKHDRVQLAGMRAREGLAADPLDEDLAFIAAHAADFQWGDLESRPLYDRYLFLRGIRHFDHRSLRGRTLNGREQEALIVVQAVDAPRRPPPPPKQGD